jgi:hypothetical protein
MARMMTAPMTTGPAGTPPQADGYVTVTAYAFCAAG